MFGRIDNPRPEFAAIHDDIFRLISTQITLLISFETPELTVKVFDMIDNEPNPLLRDPKDDVAEYIDSLNKHGKNKGDVTS